MRSDVDFVVTFEELQAMFDAKGIDLTAYEAESSFHDATGAGRGYACAGGVAKAIEECINEYYPGTQVNIEHAEGLADVLADVLQELERIFQSRLRRRMSQLMSKTQVGHFHRKNWKKLN